MAMFTVTVIVSSYLLAVAIGHPCGPEKSNQTFPYMEVTPSDYSNKVVAKTGATIEHQIEESGGEVEIRCWSKASFVMLFHGHLTNREAIVDHIEIKEPLPGHRCYSAKLRILQLSRSTGEYSCRSLEEGQKDMDHDDMDSDVGNMTSVYIYIKPNNTKYLLHRHTAQPIVVEQKWGSKTVTIPCAVSDPDARITLSKRPKGSAETVLWTEVQVQEDTQFDFDPKQGWIIPAAKDNDEFVYRCSSTSDNDLVEAEIVSEKNYTVEPDTQKITYKPDSTINLSCSAGVPVKIETDDLSLVTLGDPIEEQKFGGPAGNQVIYQASRTLSTGRRLERKEITCWAVNGNQSEPLHVWSIWPLRTATAYNGDISLKINLQLERNSNSPVLRYPCNNVLECGVRQCQTYDSNCPSMPAYVSTNPHLKAAAGELMELIRPGKPPVVEVFFKSLLNNNYYHTWRMTSAKDVLQVSLKPGEAPLKSNSIGHFVCLASSMVLVAPIRWYLNVPGVVEMAPIPSENVTTIYGLTKGIIKSEARIFIHPKADLNTASVRCEAPIWSPQQFSIPMDDSVHMDLVLNTTMMKMTKPEVEETATMKNPRSDQVMKPEAPTGAMKSNGHDHQGHHYHDHKNHTSRSTAAVHTSGPTIITVAAITFVYKLLY